MNVCESEAENSNKILEQKVSRKGEKKLIQCNMEIISIIPLIVVVSDDVVCYCWKYVANNYL